MYLPNKYTKWYDSIISNARSRITTGYTEKHHIIPKCLGGSNDNRNLVVLTAREHFICHWLLTKMTVNIAKMKMWHALHIMLSNGKGQNRYKITSVKYESIREQYIASRKGTGVGSENYNYGKRWTEEQRAKVRGHKRNVGKTHIVTDEAREKMRKGNANRWNDEERKKHSEIKKSHMTPWICPHCNKHGQGSSNFNRWHGSNCKLLNSR